MAARTTVRRHRPGVCRVARASGLDIDPAILDTEWRGTPPLTRSPSTPYGPRALAVGDAAGYVEPFNRAVRESANVMRRSSDVLAKAYRSKGDSEA